MYMGVVENMGVVEAITIIDRIVFEDEKKNLSIKQKLRGKNLSTMLRMVSPAARKQHLRTRPW